METTQNNHKNHKVFWIVLISILAIYGAGFATFIYLNDKQVVKLTSDTKDSIAETKKIVAEIKERRKKEPVYITLPGADKIRAIVEDYTDSKSIWRLVNKTNPLDTGYISNGLITPENLVSSSSITMRADIVLPLKSMFDDANKSGLNLVVSSGYRSAATQQAIYNNAVSNDGLASASVSVAQPGQSEHQTGLAVDITANANPCYIQECFSNTDDGIWLSENSYKYGFILRYPNDKQDITGYRYEPWHFRYVGIPLATALYQSGLTLDQAWPYLQKAQETLKLNGAL